MKRFGNIIIASFALTMMGCAVADDVALQTNNTKLTIELTSNRTVLGDAVDGNRTVCWSNGDRIAANGITSSEAKINAEKVGVATFEFAEELTYPCHVLYPATFYKDATKITLPSVQNAAIGSFATNTLPMATSITDMEEKIQLHHLAGVIQLQLKAERGVARNNKIYRVDVWGNDKEQMSGLFDIDYNSVTLSSASTDYSSRKVVVRAMGELSADEIIDVFVVVPAQEYKNGFTVRVINEDGNFMDKVKTSAVSIAKGEILKMPVFEYIPTGTIMDIEIRQ